MIVFLRDLSIIKRCPDEHENQSVCLVAGDGVIRVRSPRRNGVEEMGLRQDKEQHGRVSRREGAGRCRRYVDRTQVPGASASLLTTADVSQ